jgi:hypothetical protein
MTFRKLPADSFACLPASCLRIRIMVLSVRGVFCFFLSWKPKKIKQITVWAALPRLFCCLNETNPAN